MKKRLTGVLLVLLMVVSLMPALGAGALAGGTKYEEVTALDADGEYILAAVKDDSSVYAIKYDGSGITSAALTVMPSNGDGAAYVETDDTGVVWRYTNTNGYCMNGNNTYLYPGSSGMRAYTSGRAIVFDSDGHLSITASGNKTYYLTCSEGSFNTSDDPTAAAVFRVFKKAAGDPTPEDPITGTTVSITPDANNVPEESIQIDPGETIVINVTNSSTRSGYDFTATLSRSGVVELQESTVTIASSSTGQFVVTALADGKVDITIQNNNTSSNRKGILHVTVGSGGSEEPQTGDAVGITPDATDVPEESIQIDPGETIVINVTNSSTRSGYDFTATLSRSGVVELQESTVTIASSSTGQFVVTALADGKVDITIQNNNTSSNRKGIVHVTVGSGGSEEPQAGDTVDITPTTDHPEASIAIEAGHTLTIRVTNGSTRDGYDFTATLSNSGIAEIQGDSTVNIASGEIGRFTVRGQAAGVVDVTISNNSSYGEQYSRIGIVHVTVEGSGEPVPVTGVTLDKETMSLAEGATATLTATVAPADAANKAVTWNSSDETVATVADGTVTALKAGTVTITVTTEDGGKTAQCMVTVSEAEPAPEATVVEFMKLENASVWLITVPAGNDKVVTYDGRTMEWSTYYDAHVLTVEAAQQPVVDADDLIMTAGMPVQVDYPGRGNDANGSGKVDMSDVQFIYNLYNGRYSSVAAAGGMAKILSADVNKDGTVNRADASEVMLYIRGTRI